MSNKETVEHDDVINRMRNTLQPKGSLPVVGLRLNNRFFNYYFVMECVNELESVIKRDMVGVPPTPLEKLAYILLCDSANITHKNYI